jgi:hypothetical protein
MKYPTHKSRVARMFPSTGGAQSIAPNGCSSLAKVRGELYLEIALKYQTSGDSCNALSTAEEGLFLASGPFYLAVQDSLRSLVADLRA